MIDKELLELVKKVEAGKIRGTERVRQILNKARADVDESYMCVFRAEQAFLRGWPTSDAEPHSTH